MKIKMLRNKMGSNDGITTQMYLEGEEYEVSEALAESFLGEHLAEMSDGKAKKTSAQPEFEVGQLYHDEAGALFIALESPEHGVGLMPVEKLGEAERAELVAEGKLKEDGTAVESKAIEAAPKNKAVGKAPKNKAA